jgi:hypothetical protein
MKTLSSMKLGLLALVVAVLAGCAASQKMTAEDRGKVTSAKFGQVEKGQLFLLAPSGANIGMMFGAVGGAIAGSKAEDNTKIFSDFLEKNGISVEKIVREEVEAALRASGKLAVAGVGDASAPTLKISILQYGFGVPHLLSKNVMPAMYVKCDLNDAGGRLVWSANDRVLPSIASQMEPTSWEAMRDDPRKIEDEWRKAARIVAKNIVSEL